MSIETRLLDFSVSRLLTTEPVGLQNPVGIYIESLANVLQRWKVY